LREQHVADESAEGDRALAVSAQNGDADAFAALLHRHDDAMRGVVWRVAGSANAMDDILQEAYVKAWRNLGGFQHESAFSTWLYAIVYHSAIDWQRKQRPMTELHDATATASPDHATRVVESFALRDALAALSAEHLCVVSLIDGEGRSYDDVAELLGLSAGTVASRLHRARALLRSALGETNETGDAQ